MRSFSGVDSQASDCKGEEVDYMQCPPDWINDGECDMECNNADNDYDFPDCSGNHVHLLGHDFVMCPEEWKGDG